MEAQRKVTAFVTRGHGAQAQLLVFWHQGAGVQIPAGTVEEGESFEAASVREAREETALPDLALVRHLGAVTYELQDGQALLRRAVHLRVRPAIDAPTTRLEIPGAGVDVVGHAPGFTHVVFPISDHDSDSDIDFARVEGWVPDEDVFYRQERHFYHFTATGATADRWRTIENEKYEFHLYWVPLVPKPALLIAPQQEWLDRFYEALLEGVSQMASASLSLPISPSPTSKRGQGGEV